jgi:hypothetical protein
MVIETPAARTVAAPPTWRRVVGVAASLGAPIAVGIVVVLNTWGGLMPGVGFWDTGEFQAVLPTLGTAHPTGFPTYVLLGFVANTMLSPLGEPAFRATILSLLVVAVAAAVTVALVRRLSGSLVIGVTTGLGLALTPIVWSNSTRADPHPLHLAFVAGLLYLLVRWEQAVSAADPRGDRWLVTAAATFGLAAGNHSLVLLMAPPIGLFVLAVEPGILRRGRLILACSGALVAALAVVYLELPLRAGPLRAPLVYGHPETWDGFWAITLGEQFRGSLYDPFGNLGGKLSELAGLALGQLGVVATLVLPAFVIAARRAPRYALLTGAAMVITVFFNASYVNADIERYYLGPVLWAWTWVAIAGAAIADWLSTWFTKEGEGPAPRLLATAVVVLISISLLGPTLADLGVRRLRADRHADTAAAQWLDEVLPALAPDAVVVSWWSASTPLWYAQVVEGRRTDVFVADDRTILDEGLGDAVSTIDRFLGQRPVYAIRANGEDVAELMEKFELLPVAGGGNLTVWSVQPRPEAMP